MKEEKEIFRTLLKKEINSFNRAVALENGDWIVKGFIDIAKNIYTISVDTKVVSKILELLLFPKICQFAENHGYMLVPCQEQNHYPDVTFISRSGKRFAVDLKSTYRKNDHSVNGMTLGAFTGYFRNRESNKNVTFPYGEYQGHFILGVIYSRMEDVNDEKKVYSLSELKSIPSVVRDFKFFCQEKHQIATDRPGSGNTKNIGSVTSIDDLTDGRGPFSDLGESVFDDYWQTYLTNDMASAAKLAKPLYTNLQEYFKFKNIVQTTR